MRKDREGDNVLFGRTGYRRKGADNDWSSPFVACGVGPMKVVLALGSMLSMAGMLRSAILVTAKLVTKPRR